MCSLDIEIIDLFSPSNNCNSFLAPNTNLSLFKGANASTSVVKGIVNLQTGYPLFFILFPSTVLSLLQPIYNLLFFLFNVNKI